MTTMNDSRTTQKFPAAALERLREGLPPASSGDSLEALRSGAALVLSDLWLPLSIQGPDACDYLHRRLTRSVRDLPVGAGAHALQLAGDGRMQADLLLYRTGDQAFVALAQEEFAEATIELIEKYVLMDDVTVERLWPGHVSFMLIGPKAPGVLAKYFGCGGFVICRARALDGSGWHKSGRRPVRCLRRWPLGGARISRIGACEFG
jgi:glycine cleavage system aminomethyltransferase T